MQEFERAEKYFADRLWVNAGIFFQMQAVAVV